VRALLLVLLLAGCAAIRRSPCQPYVSLDVPVYVHAVQMHALGDALSTNPPVMGVSCED